MLYSAILVLISAPALISAEDADLNCALAQDDCADKDLFHALQYTGRKQEQALIPNSPQHLPPLFKITATSPYDAGHQHGVLAKDRIHAWFNTTEMRDLFKFASQEGADVFAKLKHTNTIEFPSYLEEMSGIAEGAGVPLDNVIAVNMINDLETFMHNAKEQSKHCSDVFVVSPQGYSAGFAHGHNDDWSDVAKGFWYFLSVKASPEASNVDDCAGVVYPGTLPGWAPTWNSHGMYSTQNTLTPRKSRPDGLACALVQRRAICPARNWTQLLSGLTVTGWSSGASMNLVDLSDKKMANVELWEDRHNVLEITPAMGNYSHFNEYKHLKTASGARIDDVSDFLPGRQERVDALPAAHSEEDIITTLGDFHVFSKTATLVTLVVNGTTGSLKVWCCGISAATAKPVYTWNLNTFFHH